MTHHLSIPGLLGAVIALAVSPLQAQGLDGLWVSHGYGYLFRIAGPRMEALEVTAVSCLPGFTATRDPTAPSGVEAVYAFSEGRAAVRIEVSLAGSPGTRRFHNPGAASSMIVRRVDREPAPCERPTPDTPESNFDVFWQTYAEQYGFFGIKQVDWSAARDKARPMITASPTPRALFEILKGMIEPLDDAHTFIVASGDSLRFGGWRRPTHRLTREERERGPAIIEQKYLKGKLRRWCNDRVAFGWLNDSTGYLRVTAFSGYTTAPGFESGAIAMEAALDTALADAARMRGLVIDVRVNDGGADPYGLLLASRFATAEYLAYTKEARSDPADPSKWTPGQPSVVRPSERPHYRGKIVLLTGSNTVSAGETFTMALMGRTPAVIRVGEPTQGVFSDVLGRVLPNGWRFGLPNERFLTKEGVAFDGPGIPPDIIIPVLTPEDLAAERDPALERALTTLFAR